MPTANQALGTRGERAVQQYVDCPRCGRPRHLTQLRQNFQCADVICKFCGFLAQVKSTRVAGHEFPETLLGGAWGPQQEQIIAGIFHSLFIVLFSQADRLRAIHYVPGHVLQSVPHVFEPRNPLSDTAQRAGWTGFTYNLGVIPQVGMLQMYPKPRRK